MHHRLRKQPAQHEQCRKYAGDLRNNVKAGVYQPDLSQVEKGERNRRIHVGAGSFTEGRFDEQERGRTKSEPDDHALSKRESGRFPGVRFKTARVGLGKLFRMPESSVLPTAIYQLRVVLCGVSPLVWRR